MSSIPLYCRNQKETWRLAKLLGHCLRFFFNDTGWYSRRESLIGENWPKHIVQGQGNITFRVDQISPIGGNWPIHIGQGEGNITFIVYQMCIHS